VSIIGAVSPQGADFSEPVTQNTKRFVRSFWALDKQLAYARHYAAINWTQSYSDYITDLEPWYREHVSPLFIDLRKRLVMLLAEEAKLLEIVKLIGSDVLPDDQKLIIELGRVIRIGFLQQNAFHPEDTYVPMAKQFQMMRIINHMYEQGLEYVNQGKSIQILRETGIFDRIIKMKYDVNNDALEQFEAYIHDVNDVIRSID
jgi:V/A-type H+-transporting ATPase subunit A